MDLHIAIDRSASEIVLAFAGELDVRSADELPATLAAFGAANFDHVVLDLTGVPRCDAVGASAVRRVHDQMHHAGSALRLTGVQPRVRRALLPTCTWLADAKEPAAAG